MIVKILGTGCAKCKQLEKVADEVVKELNLDVTIEHVKDIKKIMEYPILATPGLVLNEELVVSGKVPDKAEVTRLIINALDKEERAGK